LDAGDWIALGAVAISTAISVASLVQAASAKREAKSAALLSHRLKAIEHIRLAMGDILFDDHINKDTVANLREANHLSKTVFPSISESVEKLFGIAWRLQDKRFSERTEQEHKEKEFLREQIQKTLQLMLSESAVP